eukprot:m.14275 g.14275  ORF g.14275 m.14275 type:complete len:62 (-) comp7821_c0_seq1:43-228(-)
MAASVLLSVLLLLMCSLGRVSSTCTPTYTTREVLTSANGARYVTTNDLDDDVCGQVMDSLL